LNKEILNGKLRLKEKLRVAAEHRMRKNMR